MAAEQDIRQLVERYLSGQCSADEIRQLYDHFGVEENHAVLEDRIAHTLADTDDAPRAMVYKAEQIADRVGVRLGEYVTDNQPGPGPRILRWLPYAAAAIVAVAIGWWAIGDRLVGGGQEPAPALADVVDIAPGTNRATLTLADGRTIDLSEAHAGIIAGDEITYLDGSTVLGESVSKGVREQAHMLELTTPKGGMYSVTLPDGSQVWLNAASTLKYPSRFSADERVVFLEGEAYFEVRKSGSPEVGHTPFKVMTGGQTVEVLGTEFNISAYADESDTKTTLVDGSVKISNLKSNSSNLLKPGQQAITHDAKTDIKHVDVDQYTAWKSGRFHFDRTSFGDMIGQVARWYDVEVVYRGEVPKETFTGKMGRDLSLMEMLGLMDISDAAIRLEGRTLVVQ